MKRKSSAVKKSTAPRQKIHHPEVIVNLVREDGNAFSILVHVKRTLRRANVPQAEIDSFFTEATSGDYDHLLQTVMKWVTVK